MKLFFTCLLLIGNLGLNAQSMAISEAGNAFPKAEKIFKEAQTTNMKEVKTLIGYPELCWEAHLEGKVFIQVQSDAQGNYLSHRVKFATNRYFQHAVEEQVCNLQFNPAYYRGKMWHPGFPLSLNLISGQDNKLGCRTSKAKKKA